MTAEGLLAGKVVLVLSDRKVGPDTLPIHALLATGVVHHRLTETGLRCHANLVVETGARIPEIGRWAANHRSGA